MGFSVAKFFMQAWNPIYSFLIFQQFQGVSLPSFQKVPTHPFNSVSLTLLITGEE